MRKGSTNYNKKKKSETDEESKSSAKLSSKASDFKDSDEDEEDEDDEEEEDILIKPKDLIVSGTVVLILNVDSTNPNATRASGFGSMAKVNTLTSKMMNW